MQEPKQCENNRHRSKLSTLSSLIGCWKNEPVLLIHFSKLLMLPSFQSLSGNSLNSFHAPNPFDKKRF